MLSLASCTLCVYLLQAGPAGTTLFGEILYYLFFALIIVFVLYMLGKIRRDAQDTDWHYEYFPDLSISSQEFYAALEDVIKHLEEPRIKTSRVTFFEGGMLTGRREYLQVQREELVYRICAAPFGHSFFISWRLVDTADMLRRIIRAIPRVGRVLEAMLYAKTYYQIDTAEVFKNFIQETLEAAVEHIGNDKGMRGFAELQEKPILTLPQ